MSNITPMEERPPFVECFLHSVEDRNASIAEGKYVGKDVVYFRAIPAGGKLEVELEAESHLRTLKKRNDRHLSYYEGAYQAFLAGGEAPVHGTPIRSWPQIDPSMVKTLLSLNIRTVEDLATLPDDGLNRIGMGARALQQKAQAWLQAANGPGRMAEQIAAMQSQMDDMASEMKRVLAENDELRAKLPRETVKGRGARKSEELAA